MLIEFNVTNFRSIQERQTLSLAATNIKESSEHIFSAEGDKTHSLLRSCAIYGANASGKSNVAMALLVMEKIIIGSAQTQHGENLPLTPFLLNSKTANKPSEFEVHFITGGVRYQYGFSATREKIHREWLIAYPQGRMQRWFERTLSKGSYQWEFGSKFVGRKKVWQEATRDNALFLSTAVQLNSQQLKPVYDWFAKTITSMGFEHGTPANIYAPFTAEMCEKGEKYKKLVMNFLAAAEIGIDDIKIEKEAFDASKIPNNLPKNIRDSIIKDMQGEKIKKIKTVHRNEKGETVDFSFEEESNGSQRFFALAGPWIDILEKGRILVIDELSQYLHTNLVKHLIDLFNDPERNKNNAQLIFTTHETALLSRAVFRRDQIWFCEKNDNATELYSLNDFKIGRDGNDNNREAKYLAGAYGAIPNIVEYVAESE